MDRPDPWDTGWWRDRVPGRGQVDWDRLADVLYEGGFDGVLSVEHEDLVGSVTGRAPRPAARSRARPWPR